MVSLALVSALAGCAQSGRPVLTSREGLLPLESAFVQAPVGGPQVTELVEQRYPNAIEQRILLGNRSAISGSNYLQVQFFGPVGNAGTGRTPLPNSTLADAALLREAQREVSTVRMQRSALFVQNRYGPFGYAVGRSGQDVCVYAWQRIAGVDTATLLMRARGTIQIRLRLCDRAASEEQLLYTMYGLTVRAHFSTLSWNPYGAPPIADPRLGAVGAPILPVGARGFEATAPVAAPEPAPAAPPRAAARRIVAWQAPATAPVAAVEAAPLPAPIGPLVPPPPAAAVTAGGTAPSAPAAPTPLDGPAAAASPVAIVTPPPPAVAPACDAQQRQAGRC